VTELFATPVLGGTAVVIRRGVRSPLEVQHLDDERALVVVALPHTWSPLEPAEVRALRAFFRWDPVPAFWWETEREAVFRVERLTADEMVGRLETPGVIRAVSDVPGLRPPQVRHLFSAYLERAAAADGPLRPPFGPSFVRRPDGTPDRLYDSGILQGTLATFPMTGAAHHLLWTLRSGSPTGRHATVFDTARRTLEVLAARRRDAAPEVVRAGVLDAPEFAGPYTATALPVGVPLPRFLDIAAASGFEPADAIRRVALDLVRSAAALHGAPEPHVLGVLDPSLVRVRPRGDGTRVDLATQVAWTPTGGPAGTRAGESVLRHLPPNAAATLPWEIRPPFDREPVADAIAVGHLLGDMLARARCDAPSLRALAGDMVAGRFAEASELVGALGG
jgi:hypothetical protein